MSGFVLKKLHIFQDNAEITTLSELGVQFLLFDMGLELTVDRLKALASYAFGIGIPQILLTSAVFIAILLPPGDCIGTAVINKFTGTPENFLNIFSVDEAVVIGMALSLSSSAFVLQLLGDRGQLTTKFGAATLGVLLMQDIAVVPLLVALPVLEKSGGRDLADLMGDTNSLAMAGAEGLKALLGLGVLVLVSRLFLRRLFEVAAQTRSSETFVALCLFTVTVTASVTSNLGFSDTLGAFLAGVLLADTNYKAQVEADLRPFKGLLLGLFFVTTGARVDSDIVLSQWPVILVMLTGLFSIKTLSSPDATRVAFLLSQGGEFAFVVLSLAQQLGVLPEQLNKILVVVVIISLFATPSLSSLGETAANFLDKFQKQGDQYQEASGLTPEEYDMIDESNRPPPFCPPHLHPMKSDYIAVDLNPQLVKLAQKEGFRVVYGEASPGLIETLGGRPKAIVITYNDVAESLNTVSQLKAVYPEVPIYATAQDMRHAILLDKAGVDSTTVEINQNALALCKQVISRVTSPDTKGDPALEQLFSLIVNGVEARARELDWERDGTPLESRSAARDLYVYGGTQKLMNEPETVKLFHSAEGNLSDSDTTKSTAER
ncbi:hypothetical protein AAMO2058_000736500 [Amorphochlora amoebiformis]